MALSQSEDVYKFLISHKKNLKRLQLVNPPLLPVDLNAPFKLSTLRILHEIMTLKIHTLVLKLLENTPDTKIFSVLQTLLEKSSALVSLHCEGFASCSVSQAVTLSDKTLTSLVVYGQKTSEFQRSSCINLEKCANLKRLIFKDFHRISHVQKLPKSLVYLDLTCEEGVTSEDVDYISRLPNLEQLMVHNKEVLQRSTYLALLENPTLTVLALTKHDKEMFNILGRRDGFDIIFSERWCPSQLLTQAEGEKDITTEHEGSNQERSDEGTSIWDGLVAFHVDE